jgi:two-component system LytT family response regulator
MNEIKAIIIDDELHARTLLSKILNMSFPEIKIVGEGENLPKAVELIYSLKPDLVFFDIEMPNYSGLQINDFITADRNFDIIFVTAYNQFAVNAIKISAFDYLLKPIQIDELTATIKRYKEKYKLSTENIISKKLEVLSQNLKPNNPKKLIIQTHQGIHYFELDNIVYLEASGMYTIIHSKDGQFVASKPLKEFEEILSSNYFRIHRSYIVNCDFITKYSNKEGGAITLSNGSSLPLSRNRKDDFIKFTKSIEEN